MTRLDYPKSPMFEARQFAFVRTLPLLFLIATATAFAQKPELVVQTGHQGIITAIAYDPTGRALATGGGYSDNSIKIWDAKTGVEIRTVSGLAGTIGYLAFRPDGDRIAFTASLGLIELLDVATGKVVQRYKGRAPFAFSSDGRTLVAKGENHTIRFWEVDSGRELRALEGFEAIAFSPAGNLAAIASPNKSVTIIELSNGATLHTLSLDFGPTSFSEVERGSLIQFSPSGKLVAIANEKGSVRLWDTKSGAVQHTLREDLLGAIRIVRRMAFSPDERILATLIWDGREQLSMIKFWDVEGGTGLRVVTRKREGKSENLSIAFSTDSKTLAGGRGDKRISVIDVESGEEIQTLRERSQAIADIASRPDGSQLAVASGSVYRGGLGALRLWDAGTGIGIALPVTTDSFDSIAFASDRKLMAAKELNYYSSGASSIELWDLETNRMFSKLEGVNNGTDTLTFSPNGRFLASVRTNHGDDNEDGSVKIWRTYSPGAAIDSAETLSILPGEINAVAFRPDSRVIISGGSDKFIKFWNPISGALLSKRATAEAVSDIAVSPNGKLIASAEGQLIVLRNSAASALRPLSGHTDSVTTLAFTPDSKTLISASLNEIKFWDASLGKQLFTIPEGSYSLTMMATGRILAASTVDRRVKLWNVDSRKELASLMGVDEHGWLIVTPDGLFDGSPDAWNSIIWRFNHNTFDHAPVEAFFNEFYYPGLLADILAGKGPKARSDISQKDRRQPQLKLRTTEASASTALPASGVDRNPTVTEGGRDVTIKIDVAELAGDKHHKTGSGAQDVRLFRNGSLVKVWRGDVLKGQSRVTLEATIPIVAGENRFTAYAFNHDSIKSSDAELTVTGADSLKRPGTAYILSIGIDKYANREYDLKYAVADAVGFAAEVKRQQESLNESLKRYAKVEVIPLLDAQATKANIKQKLAELAKQVQPEDAVIVFFAGHGTAQGNQFYLIPHDLGYDGSRENLSEAGLQTILDHSVSDRELERLFEGIDAGQLLLVIDACNSGQALEAEEKRRGPMNSKGLAQLAYEKGMYVMTASQSYQAALEAERFGHGFLTYALIEEGLKKGRADREPVNGSIDIREWLNFAADEVPNMQEKKSREALRGRGRYVVFVGDGREVGSPKAGVNPAKSEANVRDNIQRPRIFYRREVEANPLVMATVGVQPRQ